MAGRDGDGPEGKLGSGTCYWALARIHVYTRIEPSMDGYSEEARSSRG